MPTPPANGVLLRRTARSLVEPPDTYAITEAYYDPATRTAANYIVENSTDGTPYSRPRTEVVDAFCLAAGTAPFTERRYYHAYASPTALVGTGGVTFVDTDNVAACQILCTLNLAVSVSAVVDGRGTITATVTGGVGGMELSLDNFQTPGKPATNGSPYLFNDLRPGTYRVSARETRSNGCRATATAVLVAIYGPRYVLNYKDSRNASCTVRVFERGYTGAEENLIHGQRQPLSIDYPESGRGHIFDSLLKGSAAQLALYLTRPDQLLPLFSGDERLHRVDHLRAGALVWTGYLQPEQYDVAFLAPPTTFNLAATDGLGTLSDIEFRGSAGETLTGDWSLLRIIRFCLDKLDLNLPLRTLLNLRPSGAPSGSAALEQTFFDVTGYTDDKDKTRTCGKVLADLLEFYQARVYQHAGAWWLERLSELTTGPLTYAAYNPAGARGADVIRTLLATITPPLGVGPYWLGANQRQNLRPAVSLITATVREDALTNSLREVLPTVEDLPTDLPPGWTGASSQAAPYRDVRYIAKGKTPAIRLIGTTQNAANPSLAPYIQTPLLPARTVLPLNAPPSSAPAPGYGQLVLSFTATPYGNTPDPAQFGGPRLHVAVLFGDVWMGITGDRLIPARQAALDPMDSPTPLLSFTYFNDEKPVLVRALVQLNTTQLGPRPVAIRFYAPTGGATPTTVELTELRLEWLDEVATVRGVEPVSVYTHKTKQEISRTDTGIELFHSTTAGEGYAERRTGTLLDAGGLPVAGFVEPAAPGSPRAGGDYLVRDRALCESRPAGVLTGTLTGPLPYGIGTLLTDPAETRPGIYAITTAQFNTAAANWTITAVALNALSAPGAAYPANAIAYDDGTVWADEDGRILTYDNLS